MVSDGALQRPPGHQELRGPTLDEARLARLYRPLNPALPAAPTPPPSREEEEAQEDAERVQRDLADILDSDGMCVRHGDLLWCMYLLVLQDTGLFASSICGM